MRGILIKPVSSRGHSGEDLEIVLCRSSSIPHQAIHGFQIRYATSVFLHYYYALCSNMVIYVDLNVSYSWYQSQPWIRIQNIRNWRNFFLGFYSNRAFCPVSEIFYKSKNEYFYIFGIYSTRRSDRWVARHRRWPDAPSRAATRHHAH